MVKAIYADYIYIHLLPVIIFQIKAAQTYLKSNCYGISILDLECNKMMYVYYNVQLYHIIIQGK